MARQAAPAPCSRSLSARAGQCVDVIVHLGHRGPPRVVEVVQPMIGLRGPPIGLATLASLEFDRPGGRSRTTRYQPGIAARLRAQGEPVPAAFLG